MADRNHIRPAIVRGSLLHQVGEVQFAEFKHAACAWSALEAERAIDMEDKLKAELDVLRHELARARAEAKVYRDSADHWREQACANAQEIGRLQYQLRQLQGGAK